MRLKTKLKHVLGRNPTIFVPAYRVFGSRHAVNEALVSSDTQLVIEGYPRSANTFAVIAFALAQDRRVEIAHHLHVESQIIYAAKRHIPALVLIRNPADAIRSFLARDPSIEQEWAIRRYVQFYNAVWRVRDRVLVADFSRVTNDFGSVVHALNRKFDTDYTAPVMDQEYRELGFKTIDNVNQNLGSGLLAHVSRPVAGRGENITLIDSSRWAKAERIYKALLQSTD